MAKQFPSLTPELKDFIGRQHMFFTASAFCGGPHQSLAQGARWLACDGRQRGRVPQSHRQRQRDGGASSGRRAAHHHVLRFRGTADDPAALRACALAAARQIVVLDIDLVQTSCGNGVPLYGYKAERQSLVRWAEQKGEDGIADYWREKNLVSMDGLPTGME